MHVSTARLVMAPWSKIVKLFNLCIDYVNGEVEDLTLESLEQIRGVAYSVLTACPGKGLARVVPDRKPPLQSCWS